MFAVSRNTEITQQCSPLFSIRSFQEARGLKKADVVRAIPHPKKDKTHKAQLVVTFKSKSYHTYDIGLLVLFRYKY